MFYEQLKEACRNNGTTITAVLKQIGLGTANGTYWKNGSSPSADVIIKLSELLNVSADYLLFGSEKFSATNLTEDEQELLKYYKPLNDEHKARLLGRAETLAELQAEKDKETALKKPILIQKLKQNQDEINAEEPDEDDHLEIEFFDLPASAGTGIYLDSDYATMRRVPRTWLTEQADFALRVRGDSMEPIYSDNDIVLISEQECVDIGQIGIFIYDGEGYIKRFGGNKLISLNPKYEDIKIKDWDRFWCKGLVLGKL